MPDLRVLENFRFLRTGPGVIGKSVPVFISALLVMGIVAFSPSESAVKFTIIGATAALVVAWVGTAFLFASSHPDEALMEGQQLVQIRQQDSHHSVKSAIALSSMSNPLSNSEAPLVQLNEGAQE